jgi:tetraacyldisaccharide 4'-kinase
MNARRAWAWPLVPLYAAGLALKDRLRGKPQQLAWPVVSVGSLSAGGAGKTPVVIALAAALRSRGWRVDVLSRGYGRKQSGAENDAARVEPERSDAATLFGDEPLLIAQRTGLPVWVGSSRYRAGRTAETTWDGVERRALRSRRSDDADPRAALLPAQSEAEDSAASLAASSRHRGLHLLDDGFQHRELARNFDVVLITEEDLDDALLPAGNRRESFRVLRRADAVVLRAPERVHVLARIRGCLRDDCAVWTVHRTLQFPSPLAALSLGARPLAFCAIARPADFTRMLQAAGCPVVETVAFADHHAYTDADIERIVQTAQRVRATGFVTTEKDAVKLTPELLRRLHAAAPLLVPQLRVEFDELDAVLDVLGERIA